MLKHPVRLDMNEVPVLPPPNVIAAAQRGLHRINRYADPEDLARLRMLLGDYVGVKPSQVVVGPGSDLLLREMVLALAGGRTVITPSPTFLPTLETVQQVATSWLGLRLSPPAFALDPDLLLDVLERRCLVIIDSPNNPTGQLLLHRPTIQAVVEKEDVLLIIDEAYHEFARVSVGEEGQRTIACVDLVDEHPNLAVTRTMDKAFGLAGARVGYAMIGEGFRDAFRGFYGFLPQSSLCAAIEALEHPAYMDDIVSEIVAERERLRDALQTAGAHVALSHTNFLLVRTGIPDLSARLRDAGVLVSDVSNQLPRGYIRVSVGTRVQNDAFLEAFRSVVGSSTSPHRYRSASGTAASRRACAW